MNEDSINSFLQEFSLQPDQASPNELFSAVPEQETTETEPVSQQQAVPKLSAPESQTNISLFENAIEQAKQEEEKRVKERLTAQNPFFQYSKVSDEITDSETTFEDLREQYAGDYPELDAKDKTINWSVTYGSVTKSVANTNQKVFELKEQIEKSKAFTDGLSKAKKESDKHPKCIVKPSVSSQKKGKAGVIHIYPTLPDAIASGHEVSYLQSADGELSEVRNNDIGIFVVPAGCPPEQPKESNRYFHFRLPLIPSSMLLQVISFFQYVCRKSGSEVLVNVLYDKETGEYFCDVPKQTVSGCSVSASTGYDDSRYLHVLDIHSHNVMPAFFSYIDDQDELVSRIYMVIGKLNKAMPQMKLRASCGGKFIPLPLDSIFDVQPEGCPFPKDWIDRVEQQKQPKLFHRLKGALRQYADLC